MKNNHQLKITVTGELDTEKDPSNTTSTPENHSKIKKKCEDSNNMRNTVVHTDGWSELANDRFQGWWM